MTSIVLAHQGGWDEALMVLVPIGVFVAVLFMANRRADRVRSRRGESDVDRSGADGVDEVAD
ncbi:MAG: hypothetical protein EBX39_03475 [Actinobacteria bacterium]|nr:hypothetical protein [Actinomycetota bacterium]